MSMISHYVVYNSIPEDPDSLQSEAEFERLETAMDFVEFYRRKYPERRFSIGGISYNRSGVRMGSEIAGWDPIPVPLRGEAVQELLTWLLPDPE